MPTRAAIAGRSHAEESEVVNVGVCKLKSEGKPSWPGCATWVAAVFISEERFSRTVIRPVNAA